MNKIIFDAKEITPSKIVCVGRNYVEHIKELNNELPSEPVIFIKPNSSIADEIYFCPEDKVHFEGEICFLVQQGQLSGVGFGFDLTKRDVQTRLKAKGLPWERAKAFTGSAVFSRFVPYVGELSSLRMVLTMNHNVVQRGGYAHMIYKPKIILDDIKRFLTLEDGDIIMTGTPKGVAAIHRGAVFDAEIYTADKLLISQRWTVN